jgi:hypothetical protein
MAAGMARYVIKGLTISALAKNVRTGLATTENDGPGLAIRTMSPRDTSYSPLEIVEQTLAWMSCRVNDA